MQMTRLVIIVIKAMTRQMKVTSQVTRRRKIVKMTMKITKAAKKTEVTMMMRRKRMMTSLYRWGLSTWLWVDYQSYLRRGDSKNLWFVLFVPWSNCHDLTMKYFVTHGKIYRQDLVYIESQFGIRNDCNHALLSVWDWAWHLLGSISSCCFGNWTRTHPHLRMLLSSTNQKLSCPSRQCTLHK